MEIPTDTAVSEEPLPSVAELLAVVVAARWKILLPSLALGVLTLLVMLGQPNHYRALSVISPTGEEGKQGFALGAIASNFGIQLGGPSKIEDLEALFTSNDITAQVFAKHDIWQYVSGDAYDPATHNLRTGLLASLSGRPPGPLGDWDAIHAAERALRISVNKKAGTLTVSFESLSAAGSAQIVNFYLEEGKNRLQSEAFSRAHQNKKFLEQQIADTADALTRDRLFALLGQQLESEMMARNREQFGFKTVDSARVPDRKSGPHRALSAAAVTVVCAAALAFFFYSRRRG